MRFLFAILLVGFAAFLLSPAHAQSRHALVVGIDAYAEITPLQKAVNDARAMAQALEPAGFRVTTLLDPDRREMARTLARFAATLSEGDEALFYFAGHGIEVEGRNYLLPADIPAMRPGRGNEDYLIAEAIGIDFVLASLQRRGVRVSLLILDACRDNPFPREGTRSLGGSRGLARMSAPRGTFILYSAGAGQAALDRLSDDDPNPNSVFTRALLPRLSMPGLSIGDLARAVRSEVLELAGTVGHDQFLAFYDQLEGDFQFIPGEAPAATAPAQAGFEGTVCNVADFGCEADNIAFRDFLDGHVGERVSIDLQIGNNFTGAYYDRCVADRADDDTVLPEPETEGASWRMFVPTSPARCNEGFWVDSQGQRAFHMVAQMAYVEERLLGEFLVARGRSGSGEWNYYTLHALRLGLEQPEPDAGVRPAPAEPPRQEQAPDINEIRQEPVPGADHALANSRPRSRPVGESARALIDVCADRIASFPSARPGQVPRDDVMAAVNACVEAHNAAPSHGETLFNLGQAYQVGRDFDRALDAQLRASELGFADAFAAIAWIHRAGLGRERDQAEAIEWYRRGVEAGSAAAMTSLGVTYKMGFGIESDFDEAVRLFRAAVDLGHGHAMYQMGLLYRDGPNARGVGFARDPSRAAEWFRRAAEAGDSGALDALGMLHRNGRGVRQDDQEAVRLFRDAAEQGHLGAMLNLAGMYNGGRGVATSDRMAAHWYMRYVRASGDTYYVRENARNRWRRETRRELQRIMQEAGVYSGALDGLFGPMSIAALEAYANPE